MLFCRQKKGGLRRPKKNFFGAVDASLDIHYLYMMLLGCRPAGRFTEQHDVFFGVAKSPGDLVPQIVASWPEAKGKMHVDAWRAVTRVDGYAVTIGGKTSESTNEFKLFFLNLGGYKRGSFDEYHYKMLAVAGTVSDAIRQAKQTAFYKHTGFAGAVSHIDDKYGVDVDDVYEVQDILPAAFRERFSIRLSPANDGTEDEMTLGYIKLPKLKKS